MLAALWTQVLCRAQPYHSSPPLPTSIASTSGWGDGPLGSHPEPGSSWGGNQALAEAAARLAPRTVPGPHRAGWDWGVGQTAQLVSVPGLPVVPCGYMCRREFSWAVWLLREGLDRKQTKTPRSVGEQGGGFKGRGDGCPAPFPGLR